MSDDLTRNQQLLKVYEQRRADDQLRWYLGRVAEFPRARAQAVTITGILLVLTSAMSALAAADAGGHRTIWALLATVFPALSTALAGYVAFHGYDRITKLYSDAVAALLLARVTAPDADSEALTQSDAAGYVTRVEDILRLEHSQWGQLASEAARPPEPDEQEAPG